MTHTDDWFATPDGLKLYEQRWLPEHCPRAVVALVHGVNEHSGRYAELAGVLGQHGYTLWAMDLRGHGRSEGPRAWVRCFDDYLADLDVFLERVRSKAPCERLFLLGHSMGGAIATLYAITRQPRLDGLILSAPALVIGGRVFPVLRRLAGLVSRLWPRLRLVRLGCRFISRDPAVVERFRNDPLVYHGRFPVRTGAEILRACARIGRQMERVRLPLLILHGTGDVVTDAEGSRRLYQRADSPDKTLHLYPGLYHEVLSEPEKDRVRADLLRWLERRCAGRAC